LLLETNLRVATPEVEARDVSVYGHEDELEHD
jgi:hypothetical protein